MRSRILKGILPLKRIGQQHDQIILTDGKLYPAANTFQLRCSLTRCLSIGIFAVRISRVRILFRAASICVVYFLSISIPPKK